MTRDRLCVLRMKVLVVLLLALAVGCGESGLDLSSVEGMVTFDGQPLPNAIVNFEPTEGGGERSSYDGPTDESGHYQLHATASQKGAEPGDYTVHITVPTFAADDPRAKTAVKVPAKYNTKSELRATVKDGKNTFDWPLTSN